MDGRVLRDRLAHIGPWGLLVHCACSALERCFGLACFRVLCLVDLGGVAVRPALPGIIWSEADTHDLRRAARDPESGVTPDDVERIRSGRERCFGAFEGNALVSHVWTARDAAHLRADVRVRAGWGWGYVRWSFTRRSHRGRRLHAGVKRLALAAQRAQSSRGLLSLVSLGNLEALRAARRLGCREVGFAIVARIGGRTWVRWSRGCQGYGLSVTRGGTPEPARSRGTTADRSPDRSPAA